MADANLHILFLKQPSSKQKISCQAVVFNNAHQKRVEVLVGMPLFPYLCGGHSGLIVGKSLSALIARLAYHREKDVYQRFPSGILERRKFKLRSDGDSGGRLRFCVYTQARVYPFGLEGYALCFLYIPIWRRCFYLLLTLGA